MEYDSVRVAEKGFSPDHDEVMTNLIADVWVRFAAAFATGIPDQSIPWIANQADTLTAEFVKRFMH